MASTMATPAMAMATICAGGSVHLAWSNSSPSVGMSYGCVAADGRGVGTAPDGAEGRGGGAAVAAPGRGGAAAPGWLGEGTGGWGPGFWSSIDTPEMPNYDTVFRPASSPGQISLPAGC